MIIFFCKVADTGNMKDRNSKNIAIFCLIIVMSFFASQIYAAMITQDAVAVESGMAFAEHEAEPEEELMDDSFAQASNYFSRPRLVKMFSGSRRIILTFDDGPHPRTTPRILEILKRRNIKAIFFVLGLQAEKYPQLLRKISEDGHEIGNHTYNHKNLAQLSEADARQQIDRTSKIVERITGKKPRFLRPPYGASNRQLLKICKSENLSLLLWTIDPRDWRYKNETVILRNLNKQLGLYGTPRGGAVLLHDIYPATVRVLNKFLDQISANDFQIADAGNFENYDEQNLWATAEPRLIKNAGFGRTFNVEISGNPLLVNLIGEKYQPEVSSMAMLKANRSNELLVFLVNNF